MRVKRLIFTIVVLLMIGAVVFFFVSKKSKNVSQSVNRNGALEIKGFVVDSLTMWETLTRNGVLVADDETDLAFETSGKIIELNIAEGQRVKKGDVLARLNDEVLQAELATYEAKLPLAEKKIARQRILVNQDAASVESLEELETELNTLNASIQLVKAQIKQTYLTAPFDGVLGLRNVSVGAFVSTSSPIVRITKSSPLKVEFTIPNKYLSAIKLAKEVSFTTLNVTEPHSAKIYASDAKVDDSNTLTIRAIYPNNEQVFVPGEFASVVVVLNRQSGTMAVPNESMTATANGSTVFLCKNGKVQTQLVTTGIRTDSILQIINGLQIGDTIATTGLLRLRDGMPVKVNIEN